LPRLKLVLAKAGNKKAHPFDGLFYSPLHYLSPGACLR